MAGIFDLLKMLGGSAGGSPMADAAPAQLPGGNGQGVAGMLGSTSPDAMMTNGPQPQAAPNQAATAPGQTPSTAPITQGAPPPITPPSDAGAGGLSGFLSHMVEKAKAQNPETGLSFLDRLQRFGDQMGGDDRGAREVTAGGAGRVERARLQQMADQLGMSPRESLLFQANPEAWAKANGDRLGFHDLAGGHTAQYGEPGQAGSQTQSAPLVGQEGGEGFSATPDKMTDLGSLALSNQQAAQDRVRAAQEAAMERYHEIMAGAAASNARSNSIRANRAPATAGASSGLPAGYVPR